MFDTVRLHVVSGKGGAGKTTVAAALAMALAGRGKRTLLCEVEGRQGISRVFETDHLPYAERRIAASPLGGEVHALAVEPRDALMEYLQIFYMLGSRAGAMLDKVGAIDFATTIAPGLRDVLLTGKIYESVRRTQKKQGGFVYDAVVLDAPPTGRITKFLNANTEVSGLAKVGPIHKQAHAVGALLHSPMTAVHLVTLLEEMPVQETADGVRELRAAGLPVGAVVVNQLRDQVLHEDQLAGAATGSLDLAEVRKALTDSGLGRRSSVGKLAEALVLEAREHAERLELQAQELARVEALQLPLLHLPLTVMDAGGLRLLAESLAAQLAGGTR